MASMNAMLASLMLLGALVATAAAAAAQDTAVVPGAVQPQAPPHWVVDDPVQLQPRRNRTRRTVHPPGDLPAPGTVVPTPVEYQAVLDLHNSYRAKHQAAPLQWDADLAAGAAAYAATCDVEHGQFGESIYVTSQIDDVDAALTSAVKSWYAEVVHYNFSEPGFTKGTGHFTQLAWKSTTVLGCAVHVCPTPLKHSDQFVQGTIVICRYFPYGNILGKFADNVLPAVGPPAQAAATFIPEGTVLSSPDCLTSPNNKYMLCMRRDSRLMLMHRGSTGNYTLWSSKTEGRSANDGPMQAQLYSDGRFRVLGGQGETIWSSHQVAPGTAPHRLALQNDGNLVLYDAHGKALWSTETGGAMDKWGGQLQV